MTSFHYTLLHCVTLRFVIFDLYQLIWCILLAEKIDSMSLLLATKISERTILGPRVDKLIASLISILGKVCVIALLRHSNLLKCRNYILDQYSLKKGFITIFLYFLNVTGTFNNEIYRVLFLFGG